VQTRLPGRRVVVPRDGAVRAFTVRGARGALALQVLRPRGEAFAAVATSAAADVPDTAVHRLAADLAVRAGDLIAVEMAPGAALGVREAAGAMTDRWFGPLHGARPPERSAGFERELLVRVDYVPGAAPRLPRLLVGRRAAAAPAGRPVDELEVELGPAVRTVAVVRLPDRVVLDLSRGARRLARLEVPDADARGRLVIFTGEGAPEPHLEWRNPDGRTITHDYRVSASAIKLLD
jgi:hypothetical protein